MEPVEGEQGKATPSDRGISRKSWVEKWLPKFAQNMFGKRKREEEEDVSEEELPYKHRRVIMLAPKRNEQDEIPTSSNTTPQSRAPPRSISGQRVRFSTPLSASTPTDKEKSELSYCVPVPPQTHVVKTNQQTWQTKLQQAKRKHTSMKYRELPAQPLSSVHTQYLVPEMKEMSLDQYYKSLRKADQDDGQASSKRMRMSDWSQRCSHKLLKLQQALPRVNEPTIIMAGKARKPSAPKLQMRNEERQSTGEASGVRDFFSSYMACESDEPDKTDVVQISNNNLPTEVSTTQVSTMPPLITQTETTSPAVPIDYFAFAGPIILSSKNNDSIITTNPDKVSEEIPVIKPVANTWKCKDCWIENASDSSNCVCCNASKPLEETDSATNPEKIPNKKPVATTWKCKDCWIENASNSSNCVCCNAVKPLEETDSATNPEKIPIKKPVATTWKCKDCWIENASNSSNCVCCNAVKPLEETNSATNPEKIPIKKPVATTWKCKDCWIENASNSSNCVCCNAVKPLEETDSATNPEKIPIKKPVAATWKCKDCWIENASNSSNCVCCNASKPLEDTDSATNPEKIPIKKPVAATWKCKDCWVENASDSSNCACCNASKPLEGTESAALSCSETKIVENKDNSSVCATSIASKPAESTTSAKAIITDWSCNDCYVTNSGERDVCICCDAPKPNENPTKTTNTTTGANVIITTSSFTGPKCSTPIHSNVTTLPLKLPEDTIVCKKTSDSVTETHTNACNNDLKASDKDTGDENMATSDVNTDKENTGIGDKNAISKTYKNPDKESYDETSGAGDKEAKDTSLSTGTKSSNNVAKAFDIYTMTADKDTMAYKMDHTYDYVPKTFTTAFSNYSPHKSNVDTAIAFTSRRCPVTATVTSKSMLDNNNCSIYDNNNIDDSVDGDKYPAFPLARLNETDDSVEGKRPSKSLRGPIEAPPLDAGDTEQSWFCCVCRCNNPNALNRCCGCNNSKRENVKMQHRLSMDITRGYANQPIQWVCSKCFTTNCSNKLYCTQCGSVVVVPDSLADSLSRKPNVLDCLCEEFKEPGSGNILTCKSCGKYREERAPGEEPRWKCPQCYTLNYGHVHTCTGCPTNKDVAVEALMGHDLGFNKGEGDKSLQSWFCCDNIISGALQSCANCGLDKHQRPSLIKNVRVPKHTLQKKNKKISWRCDSCSFRNTIVRSFCQFCSNRNFHVIGPMEGWDCKLCFTRNPKSYNQCLTCEVIASKPYHRLARELNNRNPASAKKMWYCIICRHFSFHDLCAICETPRDAEPTDDLRSLPPVLMPDCELCCFPNSPTILKCIACNRSNRKVFERLHVTSDLPLIWYCVECWPRGVMVTSICLKCTEVILEREKEKIDYKWLCDSCQEVYLSNTLKCPECGARNPELPCDENTPDTQDWTCESCSIVNDNKAKRCQCCETYRPGTNFFVQEINAALQDANISFNNTKDLDNEIRRHDQPQLEEESSSNARRNSITEETPPPVTTASIPLDENSVTESEKKTSPSKEDSMQMDDVVQSSLPVVVTTVASSAATISATADNLTCPPTSAVTTTTNEPENTVPTTTFSFGLNSETTVSWSQSAKPSSDVTFDFGIKKSSEESAPLFNFGVKNPTNTVTIPFQFNTKNEEKVVPFTFGKKFDAAKPFKFGADQSNESTSQFGITQANKPTLAFGLSQSTQSAPQFGHPTKPTLPFGIASGDATQQFGGINQSNDTPFGIAQNNNNSTTPFANTQPNASTFGIAQGNDFTIKKSEEFKSPFDMTAKSTDNTQSPFGMNVPNAPFQFNMNNAPKQVFSYGAKQLDQGKINPFSFNTTRSNIDEPFRGFSPSTTCTATSATSSVFAFGSSSNNTFKPQATSLGAQQGIFRTAQPQTQMEAPNQSGFMFTSTPKPPASASFNFSYYSQQTPQQVPQMGEPQMSQMGSSMPQQVPQQQGPQVLAVAPMVQQAPQQSGSFNFSQPGPSGVQFNMGVEAPNSFSPRRIRRATRRIVHR